MIGSFWNLCRACPSMPVDKQLHSEYRSTYRWHEFTGNSRPEVVRRAPAPNPSQFVGATNEPPLPRRKKCPELAYKSHEFIIGSEYTDGRRDASAHRLARSEERGGTPSRRSKSEGPPVVPNGRAYPIATEIDGTTRKQAGESNGLLKKTINKLSTEYRLQFVWPTVRRIKGGGEAASRAAAGDYPRKSISLGVLRSGGQGHSHTQNQNQSQSLTQAQNGHTHHTMMGGGVGLPTVHKKRTTNQKEATLHELEPLVSDTDDRKTHEKQVTIVERKITSRPFSQAIDQERLNHFITKKENFGFADAAVAAAALKDEVDNRQQVVVMNGSAPPHSKPNLDLWFKEMVELRKKAGEYKCRGWGIEIDPELYKKQKDLWDQVSKRSSLSALSLASSVHRPITKEEKEQENNKKSTPLEKAQKPRVPGQAFLIDNKDEISALPARFSNIRHHLERTTGPDVEEGALLPSPTREKLMPAITKRESESQRGSPKKTALSRHGSPQKGSPQKGSPKKVLKTRSQSAGPGVAENESPKRQIRSASQAPSSRKKTPTTGSGSERKARPSTLSTTFQSRIKSSSLPPPNGRVASAPPATAAAAASASAAKSALNANQAHANQSQSSHAKSGSISGRVSKPSATSAQQQHQQQQQQMRKKDKDRSNSSCIGSGSHVGAGSGSQANSVKHLQNKQKQQQLQQQQQQQQQKQQHQAQQQPQQQKQKQQHLDVAAAATAAATSSSSQNPTRPATINIKRLTVPGQDRKLAENEGEDGRETAISISSCSPQPPVQEVPEEPLVKSPPEPTRVKSPEQIIMRSPDPVNWTVPLDTGKTFTVTQNVKDGENYSRPQSEIKASTPVEKPPPPPQSAPPQLTEQAKMDAWKSCSPSTSAAIYGKTLTPHATPTGQPGGAVRCTVAQDQPLQQPDPAMSSSSSTGTASTARTAAAEVLEKARDRFDRFWGNSSANKEESV
ncbi:serine/arginine repetitive matrix protein 1 isoform X1 [Drosophila yakuba]|uniref:serine/arginine repetitive matrix protein 1 isoform X1 n=1 Tax=Drosophila yakuba TaxID=7245 RepID=UPI0019307773|nr:serine/arginine repetitive matrix protein 1 isoform X1 [Drosophila yakuba]XP_015047508.2 serine/arginine repetitive matrix protein 1 isoform X1 [Drosophila yakuba]XP_015047512.2 serine/arginine repetitive matrix protein 1 isoform X1 [Drosophila yakuba]